MENKEAVLEEAFDALETPSINIVFEGNINTVNITVNHFYETNEEEENE